ncbi:MAG TPA: hypothetical protein VNO26_01575 [Candidatus Limnocylindria bacterium]|nr:hypothetical protein [Candidatus Limnocylindria bacterium]
MWRPALALCMTLATTACGPGIVQLTERPQLHYEEQVKIRGRVSRKEILGEHALLELADARERRILARVPAADAPPLEEWVEVRGVFTAELRVGDRVVYDAIAVEHIEGARAPWFPYLF